MNKVLISLVTLQFVLANSASVIGKAIDQDTHQPLIGAIITIEEIQKTQLLMKMEILELIIYHQIIIQ